MRRRFLNGLFVNDSRTDTRLHDDLLLRFRRWRRLGFGNRRSRACFVVFAGARLLGAAAIFELFLQLVVLVEEPHDQLLHEASAFRVFVLLVGRRRKRESKEVDDDEPEHEHDDRDPHHPLPVLFERGLESLTEGHWPPPCVNFVEKDRKSHAAILLICLVKL